MVRSPDRPLVSVVVPFLNAARFLEEALESVVAQSYPAWELLLVDDGSTDDSAEIARRYVAREPERVRYFQHPGGTNRGISASRNLGIRHANGEYLAFLDADDVWAPQKLARQLAIMEDHPNVGLLYGKSRYWRSWTGLPADQPRDYVPRLPPPVNEPIPPPALLATAYPLGTGISPCPSDILLRTAVARQVGGFDESFTGILGVYEDQAFLSKVYLVATVIAADECWTNYRLHPDSYVANVMRMGAYPELRRRYLEWVGRYLSDHGVANREIHAALGRAWWPYRYPYLSRARNAVRVGARAGAKRVKRVARALLRGSVLRNLRTGAP